MPFLSPLSIFATRYGTSTPRAPDCPAVWNWKKTITGISVARLWYYLYTLLMPAIVHSFCSRVNEKSCNLHVCVNPLPHQNTLLCRVAQVGRLLANAKYAFNSFAGRIIANPQQKMQFSRVFANTWDHCFGYSCILAKLNRNFIKCVNRDKS